MNFVRSVIESSIARKTIITLYLFIYLITGINTELKQIELFPIPEHLLQDQIYYNRALNAALEHRDPYANRTIGTGYLYPPQALLIIELFSRIQPFFSQGCYQFSREYGSSGIHHLWYCQMLQPFHWKSMVLVCAMLRFCAFPWIAPHRTNQHDHHVWDIHDVFLGIYFPCSQWHWIKFGSDHKSISTSLYRISCS